MSATPLNELHPDIQAWNQSGNRLVWPLGECEIFYRDIGNRDALPDNTVLLIHGFPESSFSFHKVIDRMSGFFDRLILVDFPGHGLSDKPTQLTYSLFEQSDALLYVWKQLGVSGGHIIAHDMGDSVTTELVARASQNILPSWFNPGIQSLTFTDGNMVMEEASLVPMQILLRQPVIGSALNRLTNRGLFRNQVTRANGAPLDIEDIDKLWQLNTLQNGHRLAWKIIRYLDERDRFQNTRWLKALKQCNSPIHLCWGAEDRVSPPSVAHALKRNICPDAMMTLMPGLGHFCQLQAPDPWCDAILGFYQALKD